MQQSKITAGDSLNFLVAGGAYPASAGWALTYLLVPRASGTPITFGTTAEGDDFRAAVAAATTAGWPAGAYTWFRRVTKSGEQYTLDKGELVIEPNPDTLAAGYDGRSLARKTLADLKTARASWAASNGRISSYQIAGRTMTYRSAADIDREITYWEREVAREDEADRAAAGKSTGGRFYVRATR